LWQFCGHVGPGGWFTAHITAHTHSGKGLNSAPHTNPGSITSTQNDLLPAAELPVKRCSITRFSTGGGLFAAVGRTNTILLYETYGSGASTNPAYGAAAANGSPNSGASSFGSGSGGGSGSGSAASGWAPTRQLKGHVSTVTDVAWSKDDRRLVSCGAGGAVYVWDVSTGVRLSGLEYVHKACVYTAVCCVGRSGGVLARTADGRLQHLVDGALVHEVSGLGREFAPVAETAGGRVMLAATGRGSLISVSWPKPAAGGDSSWDATADSAASKSGGKTGSRGWSSRTGGDADYLAHHQTSSSNGQTAAAAADGDVAEPTAVASPRPSAGRQQTPREARLHAGSVVAMAMLPGLGVVFTASADGVILMSRVSLVIGGRLMEAPPIWTPASFAAAAISGSAISSGGPSGAPPPELRLMTEVAVAAMQERAAEALAALRAQSQDTQYQVMLATQALRERQAATDTELSQCRDELERVLTRIQRHLDTSEEREQRVSGLVTESRLIGCGVVCMERALRVRCGVVCARVQQYQLTI